MGLPAGRHLRGQRARELEGAHGRTAGSFQHELQEVVVTPEGKVRAGPLRSAVLPFAPSIATARRGKNPPFQIWAFLRVLLLIVSAALLTAALVIPALILNPFADPVPGPPRFKELGPRFFPLALQPRVPIVPFSICGTDEIPPRSDRAFFPLSREPGEGVSRSRPDKGFFGAEHAATAGMSNSGIKKTPLFAARRSPFCKARFSLTFDPFFTMIFDGLVKSPSAALRFNFFMRSLRGEAHRDLAPQFLRALHLELFTKPSFR